MRQRCGVAAEVHCQSSGFGAIFVTGSIAMQTDCTLRTEGYTVIFHLQGVTDNGKYVRLRIDLLLHPSLANLSLTSIVNSIATADLWSFADYLEQHVSKLMANPRHYSDVFVEWEVAFQAQALQGDLFADAEGTIDGTYSLFFAVNVGKVEEEGPDTYVGAISLVELQNVKVFVTELGEYLRQVQAQELNG